VIRLWKEAQALGSTDNEVMSEKELKREGFRLAEERYQSHIYLKCWFKIVERY
jgi:hypothetical protein